MTLYEIAKELKMRKVPSSLNYVVNPEKGAAMSVQVPYGSMLDAIKRGSSIYQFMPFGRDRAILVLMNRLNGYSPKIMGGCTKDLIEIVARAYDVQTNTCY